MIAPRGLPDAEIVMGSLTVALFTASILLTRLAIKLARSGEPAPDLSYSNNTPNA